MDSIRVVSNVDLPPEESFRIFTDLATWWPREYTWGKTVLVDIGIEPREGGSCYEIGPHGFHCDWGRVLVWESPCRLAFAWQITPAREPQPDPDRASTVTVSFAPIAGSRTEMTLDHDGFDRHGDGAADYRAAMASDQGWPYILRQFTKAAKLPPTP